MRKYKDLNEIHRDIRPIVASRLPLGKYDFRNIVKETIRLLGEK